MHDLLMLRGELVSRKNPATPKGPQFDRNFTIKASRLDELRQQLTTAHDFFSKSKQLGGALVCTHYNRIVPKSGRIQILLSTDLSVGGSSASICGAKFEMIDVGAGHRRAHIFTHFVSLRTLQQTIDLLGKIQVLIETRFNGKLDSNDIQLIRQGCIDAIYPRFKTKLLNAIKDASIVRCFDVASNRYDASVDSVVSLYRIGIAPRELLSRYGIDIRPENVLDDSMVRLDINQLNRLNAEAPYLISMGVHDVCQIPAPKIVASEDDVQFPKIPHPTNEPTIGVIDTLFDTDAYFSEWVSTQNRIAASIPIKLVDKFHGTAVCSIIVDGPTLNPSLNDNCGRFKVRHFGVATAGRFSSFEIIRQIREIVMENPDIHVWNLSLGSAMEINQNAISPQAAALDQIQREYDVIFVVAGTNVPPERDGDKNMLLGAPADSLNSLVVNAVGMDNKPASYTRRGPVLSFFYKPDVCYYGGDGIAKETGMCVCNGCRIVYSDGTSYAAPWVARKLAYLIEVMNIKREIAKALIIDSAAGWNDWSTEKVDRFRRGYGVVPKTIREVVQCENDEIRFVLYGTAEEWETYTYKLPVPVVNGAHPYFARATLVYFPSCDRNQGVDYTVTEMDVYLGRIGDKNGKFGIIPINRNKQCDEDEWGPDEESARKEYRKWDNVKRIAEAVNPRARPKPLGLRQMWGIKIVSKDRRTDGSKDKLSFGLVVTLKGMKGVDRYDDFVQACHRDWIVSRISIENQIDIYNQASSDITFE